MVDGLAKDIYNTAHVTGTFRLRSGLISNDYFDKYLLESDPALLRRIVEALAPLVPKDTQAIAGLELGGVPLAVMLGQILNLPTLFVRKTPKSYGTKHLAEGGAIARRLVIVEDVVTTAGQILESAKELRARGAILGRVLAVIDREGGGRENLREEGLFLHALFTLSDLQSSVK